MTEAKQPEALDLADWLEAVGGGPSAKRCAALLREQHARIAELEARVQELGAMARENRSRRIVELEAQREAERITLKDHQTIAEGVERTEERQWVPGSLYDTLRRETAAEIRRKP